ncbi:hypothetical protein OSW16_12560 [Pseudomonas putida]|uniref:hypothetical protein n=1 Tax=Pseudomonas putida TaxID=303 RepID=UPI002271D082|nr:hypothetical protein [Pseudomonas putida]WAC00435.1 hypothetical protein OSW16_12560 [Pseudomonas putida]
MSDSLDSIKQIVERDGFFETILNGVSDWDNALDERDEPEFDEAWVSAFEELKALDYPVCGSEVIVSEIRELVFKKVFSLVSNSEVAGYISDDFGLIAESASKFHSVDFISKLLASYVSGCFPR